MIAKILRYELNMWRSLFRWIARRPGTGTQFSYSGAVSPILWTFILLSAVEVPAAHILLPWEAARVILDVAGVYGLLWMIGLLASVKVHPHSASEDGLRIRHGFTTDFTLPWDAIESARARIGNFEKSRAVQVDGETLAVVVAQQTSVDLKLREPRTVLGHTVSTIRLYADDAPALVTHVRAHLDEQAQRVRAK
jgi:hypothetical protein